MVLQLINAALIVADKDKKLSMANKRIAVANLCFILLILFFLLPTLAFPPLFVLICMSFAPFIAYDLYVIDYFDKKKDVDDFLYNFSIAMIVIIGVSIVSNIAK